MVRTLLPTRPPALSRVKNGNMGGRDVFMRHSLRLQESIEFKLQAENRHIITDLWLFG